MDISSQIVADHSLVLVPGMRAGGSKYLYPHSSVSNVNGDLAFYISAVFLALLIYIVIRVVISFQKEKDEEISRRKRIAELTKRHLKFKKK
ncbi:MAG: hypothetical protein HYZ43_08710 [Flavobacteriia bacterium]|nr:hypothetical protein [Flavobacteriia bacterium]